MNLQVAGSGITFMAEVQQWPIGAVLNRKTGGHWVGVRQEMNTAANRKALPVLLPLTVTGASETVSNPACILRTTSLNSVWLHNSFC